MAAPALRATPTTYAFSDAGGLDFQGFGTRTVTGTYQDLTLSCSDYSDTPSNCYPEIAINRYGYNNMLWFSGSGTNATQPGPQILTISKTSGASFTPVSVHIIYRAWGPPYDSNRSVTLKAYNGATLVGTQVYSGLNNGAPPIDVDFSTLTGFSNITSLTFDNGQEDIFLQNLILGPGIAAPTVTTTAAASIASTSATLGGNVTDGGGASVTDRGVVYSTSNSTPTTSDTKVAIASGTGSFSQTVTGLTASTTYHVRAYAINTGGTAYGSVANFTTLVADTTPPTVLSIVRQSPSTQATHVTGATFRVTFSEAVHTPATTNFAVASVSSNITGTVDSVTSFGGSTSIYDVAVTITGGTGEFRLLVKD